MFIVSLKDEVIGREVYETGGYDFEGFLAVLEILRIPRLDRLVDVGANVGTICIPAVKRDLCREAYAIEPEKTNYFLLRANVALNRLEDRITCFQFAASDAEGEAYLEKSDWNFGDHRIRQQPSTIDIRGDGEMVSAKCLPDAIAQLDPATDLIWMDVQGYEAAVLQGAKPFVDMGVPIAMEFWPIGLSAHGGLERLIKALETRRSYVDLQDPQRRIQPMSSLSSLYQRLWATEGVTTIVIV